MANRSNIMGLHGLKNKTSRNSFDLSHRNLFTAKVGELLPCFVQEVNPGDSLKLDSSYFTRTAPLESAAFTRLRENVQYFFVPYQCLWKYFEGQVRNMTQNAAGGNISMIAKSPFENAKQSTDMPFISYSDLHFYLNTLMHTKTDDTSESTNPFRYNNGTYRHCETAKLLQLLGYGNFTQQYKPLSMEQYSLKGCTNSPALSVFRLLAYQKICNDFYTYLQWQPYNASLSNIDYVTPDSNNMNLGVMFTGSSIEKNLSKMNMLDMRFSNLPLDYFNGVLPTAQFGSESVVNLKNVSSSETGLDSQMWRKPNNTPLSENSQVLTATSNSLKADGVGIIHTHRINPGSITSSMSVLALRQANALQKYKEIQLANDPDFETQVEAHFGIKPSHDMHKSRYIGGSSSMIDINPVVNQNLGFEYNNSNQAITKAAPTGSGASSFKFTADTYGVVMGIYRCTPVLDYEHVGIDRTLLKTDASDFVIPELDSIGMQQTFCCEVFSPSSISGTTSHTFDLSQTYGYSPRYSEYKVSYDRYNGAFGDSLKSWVTGMSSLAVQRTAPYPGLSYISAPNLFVCRPDIVKNIFAIQRYLTTNDDNLYVGMVNMCYATRNLSRYGLPYSN
nr:MAG: major capsid protein [Microviridae sp.]